MNTSGAVEHRKYIARETAISTAINMVLSLSFAAAVVHGREAVPLWGAGGIAVDFIPQTFMMMFAMTLAVTLLARKRWRAGEITWSLPNAGGLTARLPRNAFLRALLVGIFITLLLCPVTAAALHAVGVDALSAPVFVTMKTLYGAAVTLLIAPAVVNAALAEMPGIGTRAAAPIS